ncbi:MAG: hypothetical protein ACI9KN_001279 [Gammaproteobacteria bacterium]|jgi:hypothetical protein
MAMTGCGFGSNYRLSGIIYAEFSKLWSSHQSNVVSLRPLNILDPQFNNQSNTAGFYNWHECIKTERPECL